MVGRIIKDYLCKCGEGKIYVRKTMQGITVDPCRRCNGTINSEGEEIDPKK